MRKWLKKQVSEQLGETKVPVSSERDDASARNLLLPLLQLTPRVEGKE